MRFADPIIGVIVCGTDFGQLDPLRPFAASGTTVGNVNTFADSIRYYSVLYS